jgi:hypothetical protein
MFFMFLKVNTNFFLNIINRFPFIIDTKCVICEVRTNVLYMIYIMKGPGHDPREDSTPRPTVSPTDWLWLGSTFKWLLFVRYFSIGMETQAVNINFLLLLDTKFPLTIPHFLPLLLAFTTIYNTKKHSIYLIRLKCSK